MHLIDRLRSFRDSFVLVPTLSIVVGISLSFVMVSIDRKIGFTLDEPGFFFFTVGPDGARGILSSIASTVLSVATMAFSITISVMSTASSSFGPRLVQNFMSDRGNQIVLGTFTGTFLYCLLVMKTVQSGDNSVTDGTFVPHLAVNFSVVLALACVGMLIYFINHIASGIQVSIIATTVQNKYLRLINKRFYDDVSKDGAVEIYKAVLPEGEYSYSVKSQSSGYIVDIERLALAQKIREEDVLIHVLVRPGDHLIEGQNLAVIYSNNSLTEEAQENLARKVRQSYSIGTARTEYDDLRFLQNQIVELGVRALSPGTNDPFTLANSTHELTVGLVKVARADHARNAVTVDGVVKVLFTPVEPGELIDSAFNEFRPYALDHEQSVIDLLAMAGKIIALGTNEKAVARARWHAALLMEYYQASQPRTYSSTLVSDAYERYIVSHDF